MLRKQPFWIDLLVFKSLFTFIKMYENNRQHGRLQGGGQGGHLPPWKFTTKNFQNQNGKFGGGASPPGPPLETATSGALKGDRGPPPLAILSPPAPRNTSRERKKSCFQILCVYSYVVKKHFKKFPSPHYDPLGFEGLKCQESNQITILRNAVVLD